eukprot:GILK01005382.1.p1 GENE.GILK01005382.1~~GILK01005382.1.p1  ORF type:complete len:449 (-),score=40.32 GILK01005382.1:118-1281(-)
MEDSAQYALSQEDERKSLLDSSHSQSSPAHDGKQRWVVQFPPKWDRALSQFDDIVIEKAQYFHRSHLGLRGKVGVCVELFNQLVTLWTTIEVGFVAPLFFYTVGHDALAGWFSALAFTTAIFTQIPKRFIYRKRPYLWMPPRALMCRNDRTSSFPSRAVVCAFVYTFAVVAAVLHVHTFSTILNITIMAASIFVAVLLTSYARVNFGVHFPSDCAAGVILGCVISLVGYGLHAAAVAACSSCLEATCYTDGQVASALTAESFSLGAANWPALVTGTCVSFLLTILCMIPPLEFWSKCTHFFGLLTPCIVFHLSFLCPTLSRKYASLSPPRLPHGTDWLVAITVVGIATGLGWFGRSRKKLWQRFAFFVVLYALILAWLVSWRLLAFK